MKIEKKKQSYKSSLAFIYLTNSPMALSSLVEACVAERLTPRTLDLEVRGSSLARRVVSLGKELHSTLSLFTHVYKWVPATYSWGGGGNPAMD